MTEISGNISLEIESIIFEGLSSHDARQAASSFEKTLTGLITDCGLPLSWQSTADEVDLDLSGFDAVLDRPIALGETLARFIYERADR